MIPGWRSPHASVWVMAKMIEPTPSVPMTTPSQSMLPVASGSRDSLNNFGPMIKTSKVRGTFNQKIARHEKRSITSDPTTGPTTAPSAPAAPAIPIGVDRLVGGNSGSITAKPAAIVIEPPIPCTTRAATNVHVPGASAHKIEPRPKIATPGRYTRLRPRLSASLPAASRNALSARL